MHYILGENPKISAENTKFFPPTLLIACSTIPQKKRVTVSKLTSKFLHNLLTHLGGGLELICCRFSFTAVFCCSHKSTAHSLLYLSGESEILYCIDYIVFTYIYIYISNRISCHPIFSLLFFLGFLWILAMAVHSLCFFCSLSPGN